MIARSELRPRLLAQLWRTPWPSLWLAVAYCTIATRDVEVGPVPGKFLLTVAALCLWTRHRHPEHQPWLRALLTFGLGVPALGFMVAVVRELTSDPAQQLGLRSAAEEASRFVYVLLALPLMDWARTRSSRRLAEGIWLWPATALALLTWGLFCAYRAGVQFDGSGQVGPLQGDIAVDTAGWFRAFMITDVMFVPALVMLFARLHAHPRRAADIGMTALLLGAVLLSHSRGIWLGVVVGVGTAMLLRLLVEWPKARPVMPIAAVAIVLLIAGLAVPTAVRPIANAVTGGSTEQSASTRLEQAPQLLEAITDHVLLGAGLGATLPSGYRRSEVTPWSYELAYLQLVFQTGLIGLSLLAWLPVVALRDASRRLFDHPTDDVVVARIAGTGGLVGLLVSYASNPYLVSSAGTLALAVVVMGCAAERRPSRGNEPSRSRSAHRRAATATPRPDGG